VVAVKDLGCQYKMWGKLLPLAEARLRHKPLDGTAVTPYAIVHGFFGGSPLQTVTGQVGMLPADVSHDVWIQELLDNTRDIWALIDAKREHQTAQNQAYNEKVKDGDGRFPFLLKDVVYWRKPLLPDPAKAGDPSVVPVEGKGKGKGKKVTVHRSFLPRAEGPFVVEHVTDKHNVRICDPFTGESAVKDVLSGLPKPVSTSQLIKLATTEDELRTVANELRDNPRPPFFANEVLLLLVASKKAIVRVVKDQLQEGPMSTQPLIARNQGLLIKRIWKPSGPTRDYHTSLVRARLALDPTDRFTETAVAVFAKVAATGDSTRVELLTFGFETDQRTVAHAQTTNVVDVRHLKLDPGDDRKVKGKTGKSKVVKVMVLGQVGGQAALEQILEAARTGSRVAIGCNRGRHRSVALAELASEKLQEEGLVVEVRHLNLEGAPF